ncbi:hypothetical protein JTE90_005236 [Oedothorax gibbosus]|uniref:Tc1-like transposase DDE domain-containing protein n=1 Tax=Oedothorax gibbosus TaxID=931172 RepID=A0AAV6TT15_9ARAC|nr:hypothetical protein JTE90_005236 [Oedothorax gibbosus]
MNGPHFEEWFEKKLLPNLDANSVIVMDNAPYHSVLKEEIPNTSTKKANIQSWLTSKQISWTPAMIKAELLELVALVRDKYTKYRIDELASSFGHTVLRLPPYHCALEEKLVSSGGLKWYTIVKTRMSRKDASGEMGEIHCQE